MTREEFDNDIYNFYDLMSFCDDIGYDLDVHDTEYVEEWVEDSISNWIRNQSWRSVREDLNDIHSELENGMYFRFDGYGMPECVDGDFDSYKDDVLDYCIENDIFEEDEEEFDDEALECDGNQEVRFRVCQSDIYTFGNDNTDDEKFEDGIQFTDLFSASSSKFNIVETSDEDDEQALEYLRLMGA